MINETVLQARHICFSYTAEREILHDVNLTIEQGDLIVLLGPNGAGKSTFLNVLVGEDTPQSGEVLLDGTPLCDCGARAVAKKIAYVPQTSSVAYDYDVREYAAMGRAPHSGILERPNKCDYELVEQVFDEMGITHLLNKSYLHISGGERQLVNICRAIIQQPEIIIFDEPTAALDCGNQMRVLELVKSLSEKGFSILMTSHNPEHPILLEGSVAMLNKHGTLEKGTVQEIMTEESFFEVYGTRLHMVDVSEVNRTACLTEGIDTATKSGSSSF